jgi:hypothetical protein
MAKPLTTSNKKKSPKLSRRQAAQVIMVQVMHVLPQVKEGEQADVIEDVTGELFRLPLAAKKQKAS